MTLNHFFEIMLPEIEAAMQKTVARTRSTELEEMHHMLAYHLGWEGDNAGAKASGKRIRPMLVLLTTAAAGTQWQKGLPAAVGVELIHNFSLIHDDIQDNSPLRRGRPTVWKKWGIAQAINAGDAMFALAHMALEDLDDTIPAKTRLKLSYLLPQRCLTLTQGQFLDLAYESRGDLTIDAYWPMISGKTAALIATCTETGALIAGVSDAHHQNYADFGKYLGLAFQAQDDLLGIWGDQSETGKSTESDLVSGKKSLPVLHALSKGGEFAARWEKGTITVEEVPVIVKLLEEAGAYEYTCQQADKLTQQSLDALEAAEPQGEAGEALFELANMLLKRKD